MPAYLTPTTGSPKAIASTNDRSSYKYIFEIKDKVGNISSADVPTKREFSIYDCLEKELRSNPNTDEKVIIQKVSRDLGMSEKQVKDIYIKVLVYKMK